MNNVLGGLADTNQMVSYGDNGSGGWFSNLFGGNNSTGTGMGAGAGDGGFGWGGFASKMFSAGSGILQGLAGLKQAQIAEEQLGLAKKQFNFQKGLARRNLANQAQIINNTYRNAALVSAGLQGVRNADGTYSSTDQATKDAAVNAAKSQYVSGSI